MMTIAQFRADMREVGQVEFYAAIGSRDVVSTILPGKYPYTIRIETRTRQNRGLVVLTLSPETGEELRHYYLAQD
jgi:hypothetical protein